MRFDLRLLGLLTRRLALSCVFAAAFSLGCHSGSTTADAPCEQMGGQCTGFKAGCPGGYAITGDGSQLCPGSPEGSDPICCAPNGTGLCGPIVCLPDSLCEYDGGGGDPRCTPLDGVAPTCGTLTCGSGCSCPSPDATPSACSCP